MRMVIKMKKIILLILLIMATAAFVGDDLRSKDVLVFVNILTLVPIVVIAIDVYKFANFSKNNMLFVVLYSVMGLFLFSAVLNIFYLTSKAPLQYLPFYSIDKAIVLVVLTVIAASFKKFQSYLTTKRPK